MATDAKHLIDRRRRSPLEPPYGVIRVVAYNSDRSMLSVAHLFPKNITVLLDLAHHFDQNVRLIQKRPSPRAITRKGARLTAHWQVTGRCAS